jgi:hypothetical protein
MITSAGRGVDVNTVEGLKWILIAIAQGHEKAGLVRAKLEDGMSLEEIKEATTLAKQFEPKTETH